MDRFVVSLLGPHAVYSSAKLVTATIARRLGFGVIDIAPNPKNTVSIYHTHTRNVWYMPLDIRTSNVYLANSPLFALEGWKMRLKGPPMMVCEEYFSKGRLKDIVARNALRAFRGVPFISITKKTDSFLGSSGFQSFLVPPATKRREATGKRKHILFVGRAEESKNPMFFLSLAERMGGEHFVFIGRGSLSGEVADRAERIGNVEYIPHLEKRDELFEYYSSAKLLVHPALKDPVGFAPVEALSTSTPVLVSSPTGVSDFLPEQWVPKGFQVHAWVSGIRQILDNQKNSVSLAAETFAKQHFDIADPYFQQVSGKLYESMTKTWPKLSEHA